MKPFVLVSCDFVKTGGMDRANYALAAYLAGQGREIHAVAYSAADDLLARPNVAFHRVPKPLGSYYLGESLLNHTGRRWASELAARGARTLVNGGNCSWGDINWVHYVHAAYTPHVRTGAMRKLKTTLSHRMFLRGERKSLHRARIVFANSRLTRNHLVNLVAVPESRVHTIYYGTDPQRFRPATADERSAMREKLGWSKEQAILVFIGALGDRRKGFDVLLDAWKLLHDRGGWDVKLAVIGLGAEAPLWRQRAENLGLDMDFLGFRRDVPNLLQACDALIAPTRYEAYGLGVHEALCCGLPAIVSASAGVAERYPPELQDLLLPSADDAAGLADRLVAWRARRETYAALMRPLSELLRSYTWDDMAAQMIKVIESEA